MMSFKKLGLALVAISASVLLVNCPTQTDSVTAVRTGTNVAGYVYDAVTGAKITTYAMEIETANGIIDTVDGEITIIEAAATDAAAAIGDKDAELGKFTTMIPWNEQYVVRVTADGYNDFETTTQNGLTQTDIRATNAADTSFLVNILMTKKATLATEGQYAVVDDAGAVVKDAVLVNTAVAAPAGGRAFTVVGSNLGENTKKHWVADIAGDTTTGVIKIAKDTLASNYTYTFVVTSPTHGTCSATVGSLTVNTGNIGLSNPVFDTRQTATVVCNRNAVNTSALTLVSASNTQQVNGTWYLATTGSSVVYTYNQAVEVDTSGNFNQTCAALVGANNSGITNDNSTVTTTWVWPATDTVTATTTSSACKVEASGSSVTVTLAPTVTSAGDTLTFNIATLLTGVSIRPAAANAATNSGVTVNSTVSGSNLIGTLGVNTLNQIYHTNNAFPNSK